MREIKFRGRNYDGIWMYGYLMPTPKPQIHLGNKHCVCACPQKMSKVDVVLYEVEESTIGQYTGLKDKNGKEIYEGDIVEWVFFYERLGANMGVKEDDTIVKGIIRWRQGGFVLEVIENDFENVGYYSISALHTDTESDVEIIGNIYDTPELIKEEEK